jgi:hypothetical protein
LFKEQFQIPQDVPQVRRKELRGRTFESPDGIADEYDIVGILVLPFSGGIYEEVVLPIMIEECSLAIAVEAP